MRITRDLIRAGQFIKIEVLDHVIMGRGDFCSLRDWGCFVDDQKEKEAAKGGAR
jgi:DNA repair protein RadC